MKFSVLSLNPGIDRVLYLSSPFTPDTMNRADRTVTSQGSKGANLAVLMTRFGCDLTYFSFTGGLYGAVCDSILEKEGVRSHYVHTECGIRVNTKVIASDGTCTELNEKGGPFTKSEIDELTSAFLNSDADVYIMNGSLPQGTDTGLYARLIEKIKAKGAVAVLDCDGEALKKAVAYSPDIIKPNSREIQGLLSGAEPASEFTPEAGALRIASEYGIGTVLLTMAGDGSLMIQNGSTDVCPPFKVEALSFAAAGDCFLAGFLTAEYKMGLGPSDAHIFASACGASKVMLEGSALPSPQSVISLYNTRKASS